MSAAARVDEVSGGFDLAHTGKLQAVALSVKQLVTRCGVGPATLRRVEDHTWTEARELHERIRWARLHYARRQGDIIFRPTDAARSLGVKPGTYRTWEHPKDQGGREPSRSEVSKIAEKFRVSWLWLLTGQGSPYFDPQLEAQINIFQQKAATLPEDQRAAALTAAMGVIEAFARKAG